MKSTNESINQNQDLNEDLAKIKGALSDATSHMKNKAGEVLNQSCEDVKKKSVDLKDNLSDFVKEKPLQAIGYAALIGLVAGVILRK
jgi:ElaB/YqjD/DUF883 family membrane-anchored ribosome-binding protein